MVGKSTCGSGETGSLKNATAPAAASPNVSNVVATGRRMKGVDGSMALALLAHFANAAVTAGEPQGQPIEPEIDHGRREQGEQLTEQQAADDGDAKRMAELRASAGADHQGQ